MSEHIEFVSNYNDLSTDRGFQFEFLCNRCGSGIRTRFQAWTIGSVSGALDTASSLFGGILSQVADVGECDDLLELLGFGRVVMVSDGVDEFAGQVPHFGDVAAGLGVLMTAWADRSSVSSSRAASITAVTASGVG